MMRAGSRPLAVGTVTALVFALGVMVFHLMPGPALVISIISAVALNSFLRRTRPV
jgi:hypothetical protein